MKFLGNLSVMLAASIIFLANSASAISLTDYYFPRSTSQEAYVNGAFNALGSSADSTEVGYTLAGTG
ncbi:MAG: hypothetical protein ABIF77_09210, partial [bacterium]